MATIFIPTSLSRGKWCSWIAKPRRKQKQKKNILCGVPSFSFSDLEQTAPILRKLPGSKGYFKKKQTDMQ